MSALSAAAARLAARVRAREGAVLRALIARVHVGRSEVRMELNARTLAGELGLEVPSSEVISLSAPVQIRRTGHSIRMIHNDGRAVGLAEPKENLLRLLARGRAWWARLETGDVDIATIARAEGLTASYVTRVTRLALLSPAIVEAILAGRQPARLEAGLLVASGFPARWAEQQHLFLRA